MSILKIITNPNPILRQLSTPVDANTVTTEAFQDLMANMAETMQKEDGAGLAAPQIGQNIRLIVVTVQDGFLVMVNPQITKASFAKEWGEEGCLSIPGLYGQVKRHKKIRCQFVDAQGQTRKIEAQGLLARIIQHEVDHLDGILFTDKAKHVVASETEKQ